MRAWNGEFFYDKAMHIEYAKTKSWATSKVEDPNFVPGIGKTNLPAPPKPGKRLREEDAEDREAKKREQEPMEEEVDMEADD
ncbi:hypothetical protein FRC18_008464 [Serendipita sp. 400]|nr:hypothetical protein FRC18_008464 [Serendipita sp. 400]